MNKSNMWLIYEAADGTTHPQPWQDIVESGSLIDPVTGDDMPIIGWMTEEPK